MIDLVGYRGFGDMFFEEPNSQRCDWMKLRILTGAISVSVP